MTSLRSAQSVVDDPAHACLQWTPSWLLEPRSVGGEQPRPWTRSGRVQLKHKQSEGQESSEVEHQLILNSLP